MSQASRSSSESPPPRHRSSARDRRFVAEVESGLVTAEASDHRAHLRLAYTCLTEHPGEEALTRIRSALLGLLRHHGVDPTKYHETLTRAWFLAVRHFMAGSPPADCADAFIDAVPVLLDTGILRSHYSADLLFSDQARGEFVAPDLEPIPEHPDP